MYSVKTVGPGSRETLHECRFVTKEFNVNQQCLDIILHDADGRDGENVEVHVAKRSDVRFCQHVYVMNELGATIEVYRASSIKA